MNTKDLIYIAFAGLFLGFGITVVVYRVSNLVAEVLFTIL